VDTFVSRISFVMEKLLMAMMFAIVATVTWQVFSRFILADPSSFTEELSRYLLIWIGILGAAYAYKTKAHLGLDLFVEKMATANKKVALVIIELVVITFALTVMIIGGFSLVSITLELKQTSAALGVQVGFVYSVIPLSGLLIILFSINNLRHIFLGEHE
jgi:TRAP-type C4-dicarboxylate transport system permease small subunit